MASKYTGREWEVKKSFASIDSSLCVISLYSPSPSLSPCTFPSFPLIVYLLQTPPSQSFNVLLWFFFFPCCLSDRVTCKGLVFWTKVSLDLMPVLFRVKHFPMPSENFKSLHRSMKQVWMHWTNTWLLLLIHSHLHMHDLHPNVTLSCFFMNSVGPSLLFPLVTLLLGHQTKLVFLENANINFVSLWTPFN